MLEKANFINASGEVTLKDVTENKRAIALYFSAHWCPPCRGFTPQLADWYKKDLQGKGLEVIFVSSDRDEAAFKEYFAEQPWLALDFSDRALKGKLSNAFGVRGIPSLVILDSDLNTITTDGRSAIAADPTGLELPWFPKPVKNLNQGPGDIQEVPTLMVFCETSDASEQKRLEETLSPIAKRFLDKQKETEDDLELSFVIVTEGAGLAPRIRGMLNLPTLPLQPHEHPMEKKEAGAGWGCDGCQQSGAGKQRYRCANGCDFDFCGECHAKAMSGGEPVKMSARMAIVDIPSDGAYYLAEEGLSITSGSVEEFVASFQAGTLERKQLS
jgi:thiol-disulfide isomerase/thioredoxin